MAGTKGTTQSQIVGRQFLLSLFLQRNHLPLFLGVMFKALIPATLFI
jgi:hypothetical protein